MPVPQHVFDPPFNIIRSSHAVLDVTDLKLSREFYETTVGLHVEDSDDDAVYFRGSEEHQHHSLVLRKATATGWDSRSATSKTSTRRPRSFPQTASLTLSPSHRSRAVPCNLPTPSVSGSNSMRPWRSAR